MVRDSILLNPENITKNNSLSTLIVFFLFYRNKDNQYVCIFNSNKQQLWTYVRNSKSSVQQKKKKIGKTCRKSFPSHSTWYMRWHTHKTIYQFLYLIFKDINHWLTHKKIHLKITTFKYVNSLLVWKTLVSAFI